MIRKARDPRTIVELRPTLLKKAEASISSIGAPLIRGGGQVFSVADQKIELRLRRELFGGTPYKHKRSENALLKKRISA